MNLKRDGALSPEELEMLNGELGSELAKRLMLFPDPFGPPIRSDTLPIERITQDAHGPKHNNHPVSHNRPLRVLVFSAASDTARRENES